MIFLNFEVVLCKDLFEILHICSNILYSATRNNSLMLVEVFAARCLPFCTRTSDRTFKGVVGQPRPYLLCMQDQDTHARALSQARDDRVSCIQIIA